MKNRTFFLCLQAVASVLLVLACVLPARAQHNPVANDSATVVCENARFTVLTPRLMRIEYSEKGAFEDNATFTVINRRMPVPHFNVNVDDSCLYINTGKLNLRYRKGTNPLTSPASGANLSITMELNGQNVVWFPGKTDSLNLKGTCRTLDGSNGDNKRHELENGIISRAGWAAVDDSWSAMRPDGSRSYALRPNAEIGFDWIEPRADRDAMDIYFFGYGHDYRSALEDFTKIAGKIPLPPSYVFGYWYSKYASYSSDDYRGIMADLAANSIPCDVMILDMDWHWNGDDADSGGLGGWTGWSWNTRLIPEPRQLLQQIRSNNFHIALNLHPADGITRSESPQYFEAMNGDLNGRYGSAENIPWMLDSVDFTKSFFRHIIRDHENEGVDFWWLDWQQHPTSPYTESLGQTFWCNHVFFNEMATNRPNRRPVIFHRWGGLGSHRYQIGFSGDAMINFPTLAFQPYFTATAANVGYGYWGHDLGGHAISTIDPNDPELLLRWIQFGVFTPIFRTHATKDSRIERQIWKFPNFPAILEAVRLRYALFPYIYTMARQCYDTGISICRPLYYDYPETEDAYAFENEYMFGNDILVAPVITPAVNGLSSVDVWFPQGKWWSVATSELIEGPCHRQFSLTQRQIPYFLRHGAMIPLNPEDVMNVTAQPDTLVIHTVAGGTGISSLYEDAGDNSDYATNYATTELECAAAGDHGTFKIKPRRMFTDGNAPQLKPTRAYKLCIFNSEEPRAVSINNKPSGQYNYDAGTRILTVHVPTTDCGSEVCIEIR